MAAYLTFRHTSIGQPSPGMIFGHGVEYLAC